MLIKFGEDYVQTGDIVYASFNPETDVLTGNITMRNGKTFEVSGEPAGYLQTILNALHITNVARLRKRIPPQN